jgi:Mg2+/Co2+ transporter CorB
MSLTVDALIVLASVVASAFFSGAETALTAASRARMHALEMDGDRAARLVTRLIAVRGRLISAMLLGGQVVNIAASAFLTSALVAVSGQRGAVYATAIMTTLIVIFAEVTPKTIAITYPDQVSLAIAPVASFFVRIFWPVVAAIESFVRTLLWLCGMRASERHPVASGHEELRGAVDLLHREGGVARSERDMFGGLLELGEIEVSEVMIHRTNMRAINADLPSRELVREVLASPYTRLPLWRGAPDNIIGVLHTKDLFRAVAAAGDASRIKIEDIALEAWFVPSTTTLRDQLQAFLRRKTHFALVVDEYGVVLGLVTLEDIIEEIVGDIRDEHDVSLPGVRPQPDGSVIIDGSVTIRDLNRAMDWTLPDEEATTIAGLVIHEARAIPEPKQGFVFHGFRFEVLRKNRNRITALRVSPLAPPPARASDSEGGAPARD